MRELGVARPRPFVLEDTRFWWEGAAEQRLLVQRCTSCEELRHPPAPCCPRCLSFDWDAIESTGRGVVHSHVVSHHPQHPAFEYPLVVVLVDLEEGVRLVAGYDGPSDAMRIGLPVRVDWVRDAEGVVLPVFVPDEEAER